MKGDFSRITFDEQKQYTQVLMQQGRVQLDADWNEQGDILTARRRAVVRAIVGEAGGPAGSDQAGNPNSGYRIRNDGDDLVAGPGIYFVAGRQCRLTSSLRLTLERGARSSSGRYLAYLDVWERHVTSLEDESLREVALGGPDTTTRLQLNARVRLRRVADRGATVDCTSFAPPWRPEPATTGALTALLEDSGTTPEDDCLVPPEPGYRGAENHLYRVEIHQAGADGTATFKWSRDNAIVVARLLEQHGSDGEQIVVASAGRDSYLSFRPGDWVEFTSDAWETQQRPGIFARLNDVVDNQLSIDAQTLRYPTSASIRGVRLEDMGRGPKVRRWGDAPAMVTTAAPLSLEEGIAISFGAGSYSRGDYWLIPMRTVRGAAVGVPAGGLDWPSDEHGQPLAQAPRGTKHYYASLALVDWDAATGTWGSPTDCRALFPQLTALPQGGSTPQPQRQEGCCQVSVGDGKLSHGDFDDLQTAVNTLGEGGEICLLPGVHELQKPVVVTGQNICLRGCGHIAQIAAPAGEPALYLTGKRLAVHDLAIAGRSEGGLIHVEASQDVQIVACRIENDRGLPGILIIDSDVIAVRDCSGSGSPMVAVQGESITVSGNRFNGGVHIWDGSTAVEVTNNLLIGSAEMGVALGGLPPSSLFGEAHKAYRVRLPEKAVLLASAHARRARVYQPDGTRVLRRKRSDEPVTHISAAERVSAATMLPDYSKRLKDAPGIAGVQIRDNEISHCRGAGIATVAAQGVSGTLVELVIADNVVSGCGGDTDLALVDQIAAGIALENVLGLTLRGNLVAENAPQGGCGLVIDRSAHVALVGNQVRNNGNTSRTELFQGAVVLRHVTSVSRDDETRAISLRIHRNLFDALIGPALLVTGDGRMMLTDNELRCDHLQALAVSRSKMSGPTVGAAVSIANLGTIGAQRNTGGDVRFSGNQLFVRGQVRIDGGVVGILCLGDASIQDNQSRCDVEIYAAHVIVSAESVRFLGNRLETARETPPSFGNSAIFEVLSMLNASHNQTTFPMTAYVDNAGQSLMIGNQHLVGA